MQTEILYQVRLELLDAVLGNEKGQSTLLKNNTDIANGISAGTIFRCRIC